MLVITIKYEFLWMPSSHLFSSPHFLGFYLPRPQLPLFPNLPPDPLGLLSALNLFPSAFQSQMKLASSLSASSSRLKAADSATLMYLRVTSHTSKNIIITTSYENPDYNTFCTSWSLSFTKFQMILFYSKKT